MSHLSSPIDSRARYLQGPTAEDATRDIYGSNSRGVSPETEPGSKAHGGKSVMISYAEVERKPKQSLLSWLSSSISAPGHSEPWKPVTLRWPVLGGIIVFSVAGIILLEALARQSALRTNGGGLAFARDVDSFPAGTSFIFLYLPIIIAVFYSMLLSWVDLDAKRLEPWFQLSKFGGAASRDSISLQYPFDILPLVPLNAAKRRHWSVFCSGTAILFAFWIVTPLQPAVFATGVATRSIPTPMGTTATLASLSSQATGMSNNLLNLAYGITWLNQSLPPYTTHEFATLPFRPVRQLGERLPSETWTTTTEVYRTNLTCKPAIIRHGEEDPRYIMYDNGEGCLATVSFIDLNPNGTQPFRSHYKANNLFMYIGWASDARVSHSFTGPNCTVEQSNNYLAMHATSAGRVGPSNFTDLQSFFCKPSYEVEQMRVTVNASNSAIVEAVSLPQKAIVSNNIDTIFNRTLFEYIIGSGINPLIDTFYLNSRVRKTDYPDMTTVEQYSRTVNMDVAWPLTNMAGFALGLNELPMKDLADPAKLHRMLEKAHQLLFASAISVLTRENSSAILSNGQVGFRQDRPAAILLVRPICLVVEVVLGLITILSVFLWIISSRRISKLESNPASIADIMSMLPDQHTFGDLGWNNDEIFATKGQLEEQIDQSTYRLACRSNMIPVIELVSEGKPSQNRSQSSLSTFDPNDPCTAERPWEHRSPSGVIFSGFILLALATLVFLEVWEHQHNGITLSSNNTTVRSIVQNYAPTAVATLLEPIWVILSRLLCLLQPYQVLHKGNASASKSLRLEYTSLPPQLVVWRAIRAKHFLLAMVCVVAVSTNVLAVSLAGLLNEGSATVLSPYQATQNFLPQLNTSQRFPITTTDFRPLPSNDHFFVAFSNASVHTHMPSWLDEQYYYMPFSLQKDDTIGTEDPDANFLAPTYGITAEVDCAPVFPAGTGSSANTTLNFTMNSLASELRISTSHTLEDGSMRICAPTELVNFNRTLSVAKCSVPGPAPHAMEFIYSMTPVGADKTADGGFCANKMLAGWARIGPAIQGQRRSLKFDFVLCTPKVHMAKFNVSVDAAGRVISSQRAGPNIVPVTDFINSRTGKADNSSWVLLDALTSDIARNSYANAFWHNDSFTSDWLNHIMITRSKNGPASTANFSSLVDPAMPIPDITALAGNLGKLYSQLAAVMISFQPDFILANTASLVLVDAEMQTQVTRLFVSDAMFKVSLVLLIAHLFTAVAYYIFRPKRFLTRLPTSIASVVAYVSSSRALEDFAPGSCSRQARVDRNGEKQTYGYGRFVGRDGKTHIGIERMKYVIPLQSGNPETKRGKWSLGGFRWRKRTNSGMEVNNWI